MNFNNPDVSHLETSKYTLLLLHLFSNQINSINQHFQNEDKIISLKSNDFNKIIDNINQTSILFEDCHTFQFEMKQILDILNNYFYHNSHTRNQIMISLNGALDQYFTLVKVFDYPENYTRSPDPIINDTFEHLKDSRNAINTIENIKVFIASIKLINDYYANIVTTALSQTTTLTNKRLISNIYEPWLKHLTNKMFCNYDLNDDKIIYISIDHSISCSSNNLFVSPEVIQTSRYNKIPISICHETPSSIEIDYSTVQRLPHCDEYVNVFTIIPRKPFSNDLNYNCRTTISTLDLIDNEFCPSELDSEHNSPIPFQIPININSKCSITLLISKFQGLLTPKSISLSSDSQSRRLDEQLSKRSFPLHETDFISQLYH
jgi:hypothetical protein